MSKEIKVNVEIDFTEYIGGIIDAPLEEFSSTIERDKVPVGVLLNMRVMLIGMYNELCNRKDLIYERVKKGEIEADDKFLEFAKGLYFELQKIENKVLYLNKRIKELMSSMD